jgi:hypothetical protein
MKYELLKHAEEELSLRQIPRALLVSAGNSTNNEGGCQ